MTAHWRKPIDFSEETMAAAKAQVDTFRNAFRLGESDEGVPDFDAFAAILDDDFNTPEALALLHLWRSAGRTDLLRNGLSVFGLETLDAEVAAPEELVELAEQRRNARDQRDFAAADRLRDEIAARGWEVRDVAEPPGYQLVPLP
jgi:cysteinyl-tRNA synthetase